MTRILFLFFIVLSFSATAQLAIPEHNGVWVHDEANVLSANTKAELEYILKAERDSTTNQIAVLVVPSLENEAIEDYTLRVATQWKLGKKDTDNGVLFFIAIKEHKMRIEVGEGNEGQLTDVASHRIDHDIVAPFFRQGDYDGGVKAGVIAIIHTIQGQYVNNDPPQQVRQFGKRKGRNPWLSLIVIVIIIIAAARGRGGRGGGMGGYLAAGMLGGMLGGGGRGGYGGGGGGGDYGGGGSFGGGGSSDSW